MAGFKGKSKLISLSLGRDEELMYFEFETHIRNEIRKFIDPISNQLDFFSQ